MNIIRLIAISLMLGIASGSVSHAAGGEIKLIGAEEGIRNRGRLPAEIVGDVVIVGRHNVDHDRHPGAGRIYTLNRNKWELTAELIAHDRKPNTGQAGVRVRCLNQRAAGAQNRGLCHYRSAGR